VGPWAWWGGRRHAPIGATLASPRADRSYTLRVRIWDLSAGYLNRQSLLGEHRELHGLHSIVVNGKRGYARHPETLRWVGAIGALIRRHDLLVAEMALRGYRDRSPLPGGEPASAWPSLFVTEPADQLHLLGEKYAGREAGRIRLPRSAQELWAQHKYSAMARSPQDSRRLGRGVERRCGREAMRDLARELVLMLREPPPANRVATAVEHMWGYVRPQATADDVSAARRSLPAMFAVTQAIAVRTRQPYLLASTALSELALALR
jgi:pyrimidine dimer DNA glycosylase/uncharacterized protein DUF1722